MGAHYIAVAGLHGYLPNYCDVYKDYGSACEALACVHDLTHAETHDELVPNGYIELDLHKHGNEYCEIAECNCAKPWVHSETSEKSDWED